MKFKVTSNWNGEKIDFTHTLVVHESSLSTIDKRFKRDCPHDKFYVVDWWSLPASIRIPDNGHYAATVCECIGHIVKENDA